MRDETLLHLARFGYYCRPEHPFRLSSGEFSTEYLDCRAALSRPYVLDQVGELVLQALNVKVRAFGGLTMGADPIALAASLKSWDEQWHDDDIWWFSIRKEIKGHGVDDTIVGAPLVGGDAVCIVDDVATTGGSTIRAIRSCRARSLRVAQVIILVDRQQGGLAAIQNELGDTAKASAVFTLAEVRQVWRVMNPEP